MSSKAPRLSRWAFGCVLVAACSGPSGPEQTVDGGIAAQSAPLTANPARARAALELAVQLASKAKETDKALLPRENGLATVTEPNLTGFGSEPFRKPDAHDWSKLGAHLPANATGTFRFSPARVERWTLRASLVGAQGSVGVVDQGRVAYPDVWPSTDVVAMSGERHSELFFVLRDSKSPRRFELTLALGSELTLRKEPLPGGALEWLDKRGDAALRVDPAFAIDASGVRVAVPMTVDGDRLSLTLDAQGLTYPVLVDPVISVPLWQGIASVPGGGRDGASLAYVAGGGKPGVVIFGGNKSGTAITEAYRWDGLPTGPGSWVDMADPVVNPTTNHAATQWASGGLPYAGIVYFGGCTSGCTTYLSASAWSDGNGWAPFCGIPGSPSCGVTARAGHAMASTSTHLVILGGQNASGHLTDGNDSSGRPAAELWVLPATAPANTFTKVTAVGNRPVARVGASMAGNDTRILLFGGSNPTLGRLADTWLFNPTTSTWTPVCSVPGTAVCSPGPLPRSGAGLTWDSNRKRFILFGGYRFEGAGIGSADDTWEFDPTTLKWSLLCGASVGGSSCGIGLANDDAKIAYHAGRRRVVQAAGYSGFFRDYAYELYVRGGSCSSAADCDTPAGGTPFCIEGTCCEIDCPTCQTCADPTSPGACKNVAVDLVDPRGRCTGGTVCNGAAVCKSPLGTPGCTSGSTCSSGFCTDSVCCKYSTCGSDQCAAITPFAGNAGLCKGKVGNGCTGPTDCANGQCVNGICCSSASCAGGACNYAGSLGTCKKNKGQTCSASTDCGSGFCVDGVCCDSGCTGQCQACDVVPGTCTTVTGAPHGTRTACTGTGPCAARCDGATAASCTYAPAGTSACGTPSCTAGVETTAGTCNGAGTCNQPTKSCGAFTCGATGCKVTCATSTECGGGYYCNTGVCSPKLGAGLTCATADQCASGNCVDGVCCSSASCSGGARCNVIGSLGTCAKPNAASCASSGECGSGFCVDGVCCDAACGGQCQACDATGKIGTCTVVTGSPHGTRPACGGTGAGSDCGATCNGTDAVACRYPTGSKSCGAATCVSGVETHISVCNGSGSCSDTPKSCGYFACAASSCKSSCTTNTDCATGSYCKAGACVPIEGLGTSCTTSSTCTSGFCTDGVCCAVASCGAGKSCSAGTTKGICQSLNGTACAVSTDCASGACVDGVCCDSKCDGSCEACNQVGSVGKCIPIVGQPLPGHAACSGTLTDPKCGLRCNGVETKSCVNASTTTACGTPSCSGGVEKGVSTCDGGGACKPASKTCGSYDCGPTACLASCTTNDDCATGNFCKAGSCIGRQPLGEKCADLSECASGFCADGVCCSVAGCGEGSACAAAPSTVAGTCLKRNGVTCTKLEECASGRCVDGVCCDTPCDGQCEACALTGSEGKCTPATGAPRGSRATCDSLSTDDCAKRSCDGATRDKCTGFQNGATTSCGADTCTADKRFQKHGNCDGKGGCALPDPKPCTPFACDATASSGCKSSCTVEGDCADGFTCAAGTCIQGSKCSEDGLASIDKTGVSSSCLPYRCGTDGNCLKSCATSDDCAPGVACDTAVKACVAAAPLAEDGGCGCATPGTRDTSGRLLAFAAALGLLGLRRRRSK